MRSGGSDWFKKRMTLRWMGQAVRVDPDCACVYRGGRSDPRSRSDRAMRNPTSRAGDRKGDASENPPRRRSIAPFMPKRDAPDHYRGLPCIALVELPPCWRPCASQRDLAGAGERRWLDGDRARPRGGGCACRVALESGPGRERCHRCHPDHRCGPSRRAAAREPPIQIAHPEPCVRSRVLCDMRSVVCDRSGDNERRRRHAGPRAATHFRRVHV